MNVRKACLISFSLIALSIFCALYELNHYEPHVLNGVYSSNLAFFSLIYILIQCIRSFRCTKRSHFILLFAASLLSFAVLNFADHIPFCPECDHLTAADLGIYSHWISLK